MFLSSHQAARLMISFQTSSNLASQHLAGSLILDGLSSLGFHDVPLSSVSSYFPGGFSLSLPGSSSPTTSQSTKRNQLWKFRAEGILKIMGFNFPIL